MGVGLPHPSAPPTYPQALAERFTQVLGDLVHSDAPHGPHRQGPNQGVGVVTVLQEEGKGRGRSYRQWNSNNTCLLLAQTSLH